MDNLFENLALPAKMLENLRSVDYKKMTEIQQAAIPHALEGKDLVAQAKTGSGKTAAFTIPLLLKVEESSEKISGLVLCPTRELANQVSEEIRKLARHIPNFKVLTLCGGVPVAPQAKSLLHGAQIVVGTPGRMTDHITRGSLDLTGINTLVLDEADRMLDMGFIDEIKTIIKYLPKNRQTMLFSATFPKKIKEMSEQVQQNPVIIKVDSLHQSQKIRQVLLESEDDLKDSSNKDLLLIQALKHFEIHNAIIFCQTKIQCNELGDFLRDAGYFADALHGDLDQRGRDEVLALFSNGTIPLLVATDVAARGLDIDALQCVVNYDLPRDPEIYVHRIGRTGRKEQEGLALSLMTSGNQKDLFRVDEIQSYNKITMERVKQADLKRKSSKTSLTPNMATIKIQGGKKQKLRAGDILGALTKSKSTPIAGSDVGKINIFPEYAFVAVNRSKIKGALNILSGQPIKGRQFKAKIIR